MARWSWLSSLVLLASVDAHAYCRTTTKAGTSQACVTEGAPLFWRNECRGVRLGPLPAEFADRADAIRATLDDALGEWSESACPDGGGKASISIRNLGDTTDDYIGYRDGGPNENAIFFRTDWPYADGNQVALTTVTYRSDTGDIVDTDMEVNGELDISTERPLPARGFDLHTVFAHELGHVLGLAHSDSRAATMYAIYLPGTIEQGTLKDDDRDGLCAIYPPGNVRVTDEGEIKANRCDVEAEPIFDEEQGGCNCGIGSSSPRGVPSILLTALVLGLVRASRRRVR